MHYRSLFWNIRGTVHGIRLLHCVQKFQDMTWSTSVLRISTWRGYRLRKGNRWNVNIFPWSIGSGSLRAGSSSSHNRGRDKWRRGMGKSFSCSECVFVSIRLLALCLIPRNTSQRVHLTKHPLGFHFTWPERTELSGVWIRELFWYNLHCIDVWNTSGQQLMLFPCRGLY